MMSAERRDVMLVQLKYNDDNESGNHSHKMMGHTHLTPPPDEQTLHLSKGVFFCSTLSSGHCQQGLLK